MESLHDKLLREDREKIAFVCKKCGDRISFFRLNDEPCPLDGCRHR